MEHVCVNMETLLMAYVQWIHKLLHPYIRPRTNSQKIKPLMQMNQQLNPTMILIMKPINQA
jgi:hypothetical protein